MFKEEYNIDFRKEKENLSKHYLVLLIWMVVMTPICYLWRHLVSLLVFKVTLPVALSFPPERKSLGYHMDSCSLLHSVVP